MATSDDEAKAAEALKEMAARAKRRAESAELVEFIADEVERRMKQEYGLIEIIGNEAERRMNKVFGEILDAVLLVAKRAVWLILIGAIAVKAYHHWF